MMCGCSAKRALQHTSTHHLSDEAREVVLKYECNRCHAITEVDPPPVEKHCTGCHAQIIDGTYPEQKDMHATWRQNITHLKIIPSLDVTRPRFERAWLTTYLTEPHDLRPRLGEQMPRLAIAPSDLEVLVNALSYSHGAQPFKLEHLAGDAQRGRALVDTLGCGTCHVMSGASVAGSPIPVNMEPDVLAQAMTFAPDLASVRGRMAPDVLALWLLDPSSIKHDALMPTIPMSEQDARDMAAHLLTTPLAPTQPLGVPERLPVLERAVLYAEVEQKVFKKVCWHCHSEGDYVGGDGGPGNTGGFGFEGRRLSLAEYSSIASGMVNAQGRRMSVFKKRADGTPWIVAAMHARHAEVAGQPVEGIRGMPLGLPPMTLEEIQLVETWAAQGRPK
jgi:cytochrome c2